MDRASEEEKDGSGLEENINKLEESCLKNCNKHHKTWSLASHPWTFPTFKSVARKSPDLPVQDGITATST